MQLEASDLVFSYGEADVLKSVSFCADRGERIAVLGCSARADCKKYRIASGFLQNYVRRQFIIQKSLVIDAKK